MNRHLEHSVTVSRPALRLGIAWLTMIDKETLFRLRSERGEGVISAAIAVLIIAFLGALM